MAILAGVALVVLGATSLTAQHAGFRIGIAPTVGPPAVIPGFAQPAAGRFYISPTGFFPLQPYPFVPTTPGYVGSGFAQTPQIFVQNPFTGVLEAVPGWFVPGQVVFPGQIVWPRSVFIENPRSQVRPGHSIVYPGVGTPRAQVLTQLGHPTGSVVTSSGETLYFGGISVFNQNGQVAVPR